MSSKTCLRACFAAAIVIASGGAWCQTGDNPDSPPRAAADTTPAAQSTGLGSDIKAYFTSPLHWDGGDWAWFAGAVIATGAAHHYDRQVRTHFMKDVVPGQSIKTKDVQDIIPTAAVFGATWLYAGLIDSSAGRRETWTMFEAAGLSTVTAYALKYAVGRERPDETSDPNAWRKGSNSFPSWHVTAAFAVGTVLAESGNDDYRWLRRALGYGLGAATAYERLNHNAHWLSDVVAGSALGIASARFAMQRNYRNGTASNFLVVPVQGGAMLTYQTSLP